MGPIPQYLSPLTQTMGVVPSGGETSSPRVHPSNNLKRLLQILGARPKPQLLDLGRLESHNIDWLIHKGFKVSVDDRITLLTTPAMPPLDNQKEEKKIPSPPSLEILEYAASSFDGILCWDLFDYIVMKQAQVLLSGLEAILKPKGLLLAFFNFNRSTPLPPIRYRIHGEDQLEYKTLTADTIPRRVYENREIQDLFSKFKLLNSCFLKNQMREVLVQKE